MLYHIQVRLSLIQSFSRSARSVWVRVDEVVPLGAPLFPGSALDKTWRDCCVELNRAVHSFASLSAQDSLLLLRISFGALHVAFNISYDAHRLWTIQILKRLTAS